LGCARFLKHRNLKMGKNMQPISGSLCSPQWSARVPVAVLFVETAVSIRRILQSYVLLEKCHHLFIGISYEYLWVSAMILVRQMRTLVKPNYYDSK